MSAAVRNTVPSASPQLVANFIAFTGQPPPAGLTWGQILENSLTKQLALGPRALTYDYDRFRQSIFNGVEDAGEIVDTQRMP